MRVGMAPVHGTTLVGGLTTSTTATTAVLGLSVADNTWRWEAGLVVGHGEKAVAKRDTVHLGESTSG